MNEEDRWKNRVTLLEKRKNFALKVLEGQLDWLLSEVDHGKNTTKKERIKTK